MCLLPIPETILFGGFHERSFVDLPSDMFINHRVNFSLIFFSQPFPPYAKSSF